MDNISSHECAVMSNQSNKGTNKNENKGTPNPLEQSVIEKCYPKNYTCFIIRALILEFRSFVGWQGSINF